MPESPSIGWVVARSPWLGGEFLRATRPAALVNARLGWHTAVSERMAVEEGRPGVLLVHENGDSFRPSVLVFRPIRQDLRPYISEAHEAGQLVVADLDDDFWSHEDRPDRGGKGYAEREIVEGVDHFEDWLPHCDAFIASTRHLQEIMEYHVSGPVVHLPNCYDTFGIAKYGQIPGPGRRIGTRLWLHGRSSRDLQLYDELIWPSILDLDLTFVHLGADPDLPTFVDRGWPADRVEGHPSLPAPLMGEVLGTLSVGVICLGQADFNAAKTLTHPVELASLGLPLVVVDEMGFYRGVPGVVEANLDAVEDRLARLTSDPAYWQAESRKSKRWAVEVGESAQGDYLWGIRQLIRRLAP